MRAAQILWAIGEFATPGIKKQRPNPAPSVAITAIPFFLGIFSTKKDVVRYPKNYVLPMMSILIPKLNPVLSVELCIP